VKRINFTTDTIWYKLFSFTPWTVLSTKIDTSYNYTWLAKETKLALAELAYDTLDNPKKFTWSLIPPLSTSLSENNSAQDAIAYPVPTSDIINFQFNIGSDAESYLNIYNVYGQLVKREKLLSRTIHKSSVAELPPGLFSWQINRSNQTTLTGKFVIDR
jgi:hypothetical protein